MTSAAKADTWLDVWGLARALGEQLARKFTEQRKAQRRKTKHPNAYGRKSKREDALRRFAVAVVDGDHIEIRCADRDTAAWTPIADYHERLVSAEGYMPVMVIVRVVGWGGVR